ncbi:LysR family transcriptional regulator [Azospirillum sp. 412522]|nr:LysR family transcriptional regulator [Azospirillum sp. 412522]MBY6264944.1 LysR family transcriptional regulator [Azospirillum sp. 412522]
MELRQLRYFVAVARLGHFGRAAATLRLAQPALSRQVANLEAELGVKLLQRHSRGVSLTAEGELILGRAEALLAEASALAQDARAQQTEPQGLVTVGFSPSVAEQFAAPLIIRSLQRYPKVRLRVMTASSPVLETWIHEGQLDVAILNGPTDPSRFLLTPLLEEPICLIGLRDDPRLSVERIDIGCLEHVPLIVTGPPDGPMQRILFAAQAKAGRSFAPLAQVDTAGVARQLVSAGVGLMVDVPAVARVELAAGLLKAVPIANLCIQRFLARDKGRAGSDTVAQLAMLLRHCVTDTITHSMWPDTVSLLDEV